MRQTFKPGDKIVIDYGEINPPDDYGSHDRKYYIIADIYKKGPQLVNLQTGEIATAPIVCQDINAITEDEMNATHGISQFQGQWKYFHFNFWEAYAF